MVKQLKKSVRQMINEGAKIIRIVGMDNYGRITNIFELRVYEDDQYLGIINKEGRFKSHFERLLNENFVNCPDTVGYKLERIL